MIRQLLFIKFPIIFPIIYGFILYTFPEYEKELIIITLLLLAETHFAATWPFFLAKSNIDHIKKDPLKLIFFPISITLFSIIGFFLFKSLFLMIFFMANVYHVTRQSFGVCKLYCKDNLEIKFQENYIYIFNFIFFIVAFLRFYMPVINEDNIITLNIIISVNIYMASVLRYGSARLFASVSDSPDTLRALTLVNNVKFGFSIERQPVKSIGHSKMLREAVSPPNPNVTFNYYLSDLDNERLFSLPVTSHESYALGMPMFRDLQPFDLAFVALNNYRARNASV